MVESPADESHQSVVGEVGRLGPYPVVGFGLKRVGELARFFPKLGPDGFGTAVEEPLGVAASGSRRGLPRLEGVFQTEQGGSGPPLGARREGVLKAGRGARWQVGPWGSAR